MGEREERDIAAIKARVAETRKQLESGAPEVLIGGQFTSEQLGLRVVWADAHGHLWRDDGDRLTNIGAVPLPGWCQK